MSPRQNVKRRANIAKARLVALVSFLLVFVGGIANSHAARAPAPVCTPDGQSMPAPLQRTALSGAELRRGTCATATGPSWDVLPEHPSLPVNWSQFAGETLWVGDLSVRAARGVVVSLAAYEAIHVTRPGFASSIFRPPKRASRV
jgi:hypothetical protein